MEDSILKSTKKILGLAEDYTPFDLDILTHINSAFSILVQIGLPIDGFFVEDDVLKWSDLALPQDQLGLVRTYVCLKVRSLFDPPATSFLINSIKEQTDEYLVRLSYMREALIPLGPDTSSQGEEDVLSANGVQSTPLQIWILDYDLGYEPAGFRFTTLDEQTELEPAEITYVNGNRTLVTWPEPIAGKWWVS